MSSGFWRAQRYWLLLAVPVALWVGCDLTQPFRKTLVTQRISTYSLSKAQALNLKTAAHRLDGLILKPNEMFSFNQAVGPRTETRGYQPAPSYMRGDSPDTVGGGICLLSSGLYRLALSAGLQVNQRVPHLRIVHSVPPGLDATVWYGGADLKFTNTLPFPLRLEATTEKTLLKLALKGSKRVPLQAIRRQTVQRNPQQVMVTVFQGKRPVSRDLYQL